MTTYDFRRGSKHVVASESTFTAGELDLDEKEALCRALLVEFGASSVKQSGDELLHNCVLPGHDDRKPSAFLNFRKLTYHCWSCGRSGGLLWFISTCRDEDIDETRRWLDQETGYGPDEMPLSSLLSFFDSLYGDKERPPPMPRMDRSTLNRWMALHPYMTEVRRIPEENCKRFLVGYAPEYLVGRTAEGKEIRSERIIIPHFWKGDLVGWQHRRIYNDGSAKYLNSTDFPKDRTIFNYDAKRPAVVVESPMSVIAMADRIINMEATFGAEVTDNQVKLLAEHPKIILWFDNDEAGWRATETIGEQLIPYSEVYVVENPYNADPADFVKHGRGDDAVALASNLVPYALWTRPRVLEDLKEPENAVA